MLGCVLMLLLGLGAFYAAYLVARRPEAFRLVRFAKNSEEARLEARTARIILVYAPLFLGALIGLEALLRSSPQHGLEAGFLILYALSYLRPAPALALFWGGLGVLALFVGGGCLL